MADKATIELFKKLLKDSGSNDFRVAMAAQRQFAKALELPLREGVMAGDIVSDIFEVEDFEPGVPVEYPLSFLAPGTEKDYVAFTIPNQGVLPSKHIEGDYVMVPTYDVGAAISWLLKYAKYARWNIIQKALEVFEMEFVKKDNDDGWHTLLAAALDRNIVVYDSDAAAGNFTKRLVSLMKLTMRRNAGGNSSSLNRGKLTDLYLSPEGLEDIRNWGVDLIDEITRREIFTAEDGAINRIFGVNLHDIDELGEGQEYQLWFTNTLGGSLQGSDLELVIGLDLQSNDSFFHPTVGQLEVFEDPMLHRERRAGVYGWKTGGWAVLDQRRILAGSF